MRSSTATISNSSHEERKKKKSIVQLNNCPNIEPHIPIIPMKNTLTCKGSKGSKDSKGSDSTQTRTQTHTQTLTQTHGQIQIPNMIPPNPRQKNGQPLQTLSEENKHSNDDNFYRCANILFFHDNDNEPYGNKSYIEETVFSFVKKLSNEFQFRTIAFKLVRDLYWVQVNGGPISDLDGELGRELLFNLNSYSGKNAKFIKNPFENNVYSHIKPIKVNRWFVIDTVVKSDW